MPRLAAILAPVFLSAASAGASETSRTAGLLVRAYDRATGALSTRLTAGSVTQTPDGVFTLQKVHIRSWGRRGTTVDTTAESGSYDGERGLASLSGGVRTVYQPIDGTDESATVTVERMVWREGRSSMSSDSEVRSEYLRGGAVVAQIKGRGLEIEPEEGRITLLKPDQLVLHGGWGLVGRLDEPGSAAADGKPARVACGGPMRLDLPTKAERRLALSMAGGVRLTEPEGTMSCETLKMRLKPVDPTGGAAPSASGYSLEWAEATGGARLASSESTASARRAEYNGEFDVLLLEGTAAEEAVLSQPRKVLRAPRILIDRKARSIRTGGEEKTRLTIERDPEPAVEPEPEI